MNTIFFITIPKKDYHLHDIKKFLLLQISLINTHNLVILAQCKRTMMYA